VDPVGVGVRGLQLTLIQKDLHLLLLAFRRLRPRGRFLRHNDPFAQLEHQKSCKAAAYCVANGFG
jgi:hypothetical protein